jgi:hypothetical protein
MLSSVVLVVALFVVVAALAAWALAQDRDAATIAWQTDIEAARARAASSGRPLMIVFR